MSFLHAYMTPRQIRIWDLFRKGLSQADIARQCKTTRQTTNHALHNATEKMTRTLLEAAKIQNLKITVLDPKQGFVTGHSTQTSDIVQVLDSTTALLLNIESDGELALPQDSKAFKLGAGLDMTMYYDGTDGYINTAAVAPSDLHIDCGTERTAVLDEPVWDDINLGASQLSKPASSQPDIHRFDWWYALLYVTGAGQRAPSDRPSQ